MELKYGLVYLIVRLIFWLKRFTWSLSLDKLHEIFPEHSMVSWPPAPTSFSAFIILMLWDTINKRRCFERLLNPQKSLFQPRVFGFAGNIAARRGINRPTDFLFFYNFGNVA
ncbi:hypothetical protein RF11_14935 [Thelohanellus kitauei]|uniref:Uncharacterized protein n=1 Tax=Thelohanellus kitauei TaxID=669202 RepID=A0A0C2JWD8_THEKT|nr:hypothetical protein RF11_14935 [Thelohanellus kitauei]